VVKLPLAVAVVIRQDARFLLIQRGQHPFQGWWSPITGRVEGGETLPAAAAREAHEEMGLVVEVGEQFFVCPTADGSHELHFFEARWTRGHPTPCLREVRAWGWFTLAQAGRLVRIFPADLHALHTLRSDTTPVP
jgi:8-oxo-dGTP diphosphatase